MFSTPRRRNFVLFVIGALTFATVALCIYAIDRIGDCTTPGGDCYTRQSERTKELVALSRLITVTAAECARDNEVRSVRRCVDRKLGPDANLSDLLKGAHR